MPVARGLPVASGEGLPVYAAGGAAIGGFSSDTVGAGLKGGAERKALHAKYFTPFLAIPGGELDDGDKRRREDVVAAIAAP